jgi:hypothetical protein
MYRKVALATAGAAFVFMLVPDAQGATRDRTDRMQDRIEPRIASIEERVAGLIDRYCEQFEDYHEQWGTRLPDFCNGVEPPPPGDEPAPTVVLSLDLMVIEEGDESELSWSSEHADECTASGGWSGDRALSGAETVSPEESTAYTLECTGAGGAATYTAVLAVVPAEGEEPPPPPPPAEGLLISEVYYDVDAEHGAESANEWVEIHNLGDAPADVSDFTLADGASSDVLPEGTMIPAGGYLIVTNSTTTDDFWTFPEGTVVVHLESPIGNGLGNAGDVLFLSDTEATVLDSVSWGSDTSAFDPSAPDVAEGSSLDRVDNETDTDTAADWEENETPDPGT